MERFVLQNLSHAFGFAREFLALLVLKRKTIEHAFSDENFAIQFAVFGALFTGTAFYLWFSAFTETTFARTLAGAVYLIVDSVVVSVCCIAIAVKLFRRRLQTGVAWRASIVSSTLFSTLFSVLYLFETGKMQAFEVFWAAFPHGEFSHDLDMYISVVAWSAALIYGMVFSYVAIRTVAEFHAIDRVRTFFLVGVLVSLPLFIVTAPITSVMYSIIGVTQDDMVFALQEIFGVGDPH